MATYGLRVRFVYVATYGEIRGYTGHKSPKVATCPLSWVPTADVIKTAGLRPQTCGPGPPALLRRSTRSAMAAQSPSCLRQKALRSAVWIGGLRPSRMSAISAFASWTERSTAAEANTSWSSRSGLGPMKPDSSKERGECRTWPLAGHEARLEPRTFSNSRRRVAKSRFFTTKSCTGAVRSSA